MTNINVDEFERLTDKEKEEVLRVLDELSNGDTSTLNDLRYRDYAEIPVDILTFIKNEEYLGKAWHSSEGKLKLFPYWERVLTKLFPDNLTTSVNTFIESGARGLGKSEIAVTCALYMMYRAMCLKSPLSYYNLKPTEKLCFAFMNITEALALDIGMSKFQSTVQMSPWFMKRGTVTGRDTLIWNPPSYISIIIGSQPRHVIGLPIIFAFFDEVSFIANQDIEKQKQKALDMIDTALGGMQTRFLNNGQSPALLVLASSKRSEKSFLETHTKKKVESEGNNIIVVDEPVWNVRPSTEYSGKRFKVGLGNKFLASIILPENISDEESYEYVKKGYKVIDVPIEYKAKFTEDIDRALCDYAGVSSSELTKYISATRFNEAKHSELSNPFTKNEIIVGNAKDDTVQYYDFFDLSKVPSEMKSKPLFVHLDMSISGDCTGIGGVWIKGKKPGLNNTGKELYLQTAFNVSIRAPKGYQVSFAKNREFIFWLRKQGFFIREITSDTYQNATLAQDFIASGFNYSVLSVDRVNSDKICEPYAYIKNAIYEQRLFMYDDSILTQEFLDLERNGNTGKVDHPENGRKDAADAITGATFSASKHSDEYNFYYGEDLDSTKEANVSQFDDLKQMTVDFEEELKKVFGHKEDSEHFKDFGLGKATALNDDFYMIHEGIIL